MLQTVEGIYQNGRVELTETPERINRAKVFVTFVEIENAAPENKSAEKRKSFAEAAAHLIGSVKDGLPPDISVNKKYLEGLGRD